MNDKTTLSTILSKTDNSSNSIHSSAASMMRLYDKSPALAVSEWRNALQSCRNFQLLPLLYVANEVLQISKRNRGNRFLEEFSPVLKTTLQFICERDRDVVEKVRRTAKIWGDRRVFSVRFVMELLRSLESFRQTHSPYVTIYEKSNSLSISYDSVRNNTSSSITNNTIKNVKNPIKKSIKGTDNEVANDINVDSPVTTLSTYSNSVPSLLDVDNIKIDHIEIQKSIDKTSSTDQETKSRSPFGKKRRRSEVAASRLNNNYIIGLNNLASLCGDVFSGNEKDRINFLDNKQSSLSFTALSDIFDQMAELDRQFLSVQSITSSMDFFIGSNNHKDDIMEKVGDELIELNQEVNTKIKTVRDQKSKLHFIANRKRLLEDEIRRYQPWLENALKIDDDELASCEELNRKLELIKVIHADAKKSREKKREKEAKERALSEAAARKQADEEELKRSLENTMKNDIEPKEGMVWNKQLREYQYLPDGTEESWRD